MEAAAQALAGRPGDPIVAAAVARLGDPSARVEALSVEAVRAYHAAHFGPDALTVAFAGDFDAALARFAEGSETPEADPAQEPPAPAENSSPGQWSKRSTAPAAPAVEPCPECGGKCLGPVWLLTWSDCQHSGNRIARMEEARPHGAKGPGEFPGHSEYDVEEEQLAAFEEGVEEWWRVVPAGPGEDPDFWHYAY
jgi:hypothetical protein